MHVERRDTVQKYSVHICNRIITLIYLQQICHKINIFIEHIASMHAQSLSRVQLFTTPGIVCSPSGSSVHGKFPDKNTGVGCHFLLSKYIDVVILTSTFILYHLIIICNSKSRVFLHLSYELLLPLFLVQMYIRSMIPHNIMHLLAFKKIYKTIYKEELHYSKDVYIYF